MPSPVLCPNCGASLDVPGSFAGRQVRCGTCKTTFAVASDDRDIPTVRPVSEATTLRKDDPYTDPPRRQKRSRMGCVMIALVLGGLGSLTCCCSGVWLMDYVDSPTFETYTPPEGGYTVDFPGVPSPFSRPGLDGKPARGTEYLREFPQERYFVEYVLLKQDEQKMDPQKLLAKACDSWAKATPNGKEDQRSPRDVNGFPGLDLILKQGQFQGATILRVIKVNDRLYSVGVSGQIQPEQNRGFKFMDSFKPDAVPEK